MLVEVEHDIVILLVLLIKYVEEQQRVDEILIILGLDLMQIDELEVNDENIILIDEVELDFIEIDYELLL